MLCIGLSETSAKNCIFRWSDDMIVLFSKVSYRASNVQADQLSCLQGAFSMPDFRVQRFADGEKGGKEAKTQFSVKGLATLRSLPRRYSW